MTPQDGDRKRQVRAELTQKLLELETAIKEGMFAFSQDHPIEKVPSRYRPIEQAAWKIGWNRGKAFFEGVKAKANDTAENPYPTGTDYAQYWQIGRDAECTLEDAKSLLAESTDS